MSNILPIIPKYNQVICTPSDPNCNTLHCEKEYKPLLSTYPQIHLTLPNFTVKVPLLFNISPKKSVVGLIQSLAKQGFVNLGQIEGLNSLTRHIGELRKTTYDFITQSHLGESTIGTTEFTSNLMNEILDKTGLSTLKYCDSSNQLTPLKRKQVLLKKNCVKDVKSSDRGDIHEDGLALHLLVTMRSDLPDTEFISKEKEEKINNLAEKTVANFKYLEKTAGDYGLSKEDLFVANIDDDLSLPKEERTLKKEAHGSLNFIFQRLVRQRGNQDLLTSFNKNPNKDVANILLFAGRAIKNVRFADGQKVIDRFPDLKPLKHATPYGPDQEERLLMSFQLIA